MASVPKPCEDWERINAKSWELPNYGPGPDFGRGTIYRQDNDEYAENTGRDSDDFDFDEEGPLESVKYDRPPWDDSAHPTSSTAPVIGPIPSVPPVPKQSPIPSQSFFQTGPRPGRAQAPEGPIFNDRGLNTSSSNTFARPNHSARNVRPGQSKYVKKGNTRASRPPFQSNKGRVTSGPSQHRGKNRPIPPGQNDSYSKARWRKGLPPDASYRLPYECQVFQEKIRQVTPGEASSIDFRQRIIEDTGSYVRISSENAKLVHIWGREEQVLGAQNMLQDMLSRLMRQRTLSKASRWTKVRAHSNTKVANALSRANQEERLSEMRKPPKTAMSYTLAFLWPADGPSLNYFFTARRELLDYLRLKYAANIYIRPSIQDCLFMSGNRARDMCIIASRFRELWERLMVQQKTEIKLFLIAAPRVELMRTHVVLQRLGGVSSPALCGPELAPDVAATWGTTAEEIKLNNKITVTTHLRKTLKLIPKFRGLLQMRAKFGLFVLQRWRKPDDGTSYQFSEFREMLAHANTEGRLLPGIRLPQDEIFQRIMKSKFLKPWGKAPITSLPTMMPRYSAIFEYQPNDDLMIRVEAKFSLPLGSQEFEVNGIRCYKAKQIGAPADRQMPLQISMIDLERSDWQLEVKALELCPDKEMPPDLEKFLRSIRFQWNPSVKNMGAVPQRRARFLYGSPVKRFIEKATIQLQVIDSPHVFELARFDEYTYTTGHWCLKPKVSWGASLFNPTWDDILGEQAEVNVDDISKEGCLSVFFPPPEGEEQDNDKEKTDEEVRKEAETRKKVEEEQLGQFMSTVQQVARMLGNPGGELSDVLETELGSLF